MTWPSSDVDNTNVSSGSAAGAPAAARLNFKDLIDKFNLVRNHVSSFWQGVLSATTAASARSALGALGATDTIARATSAANADHATAADSATNATNATQATNATHVNGVAGWLGYSTPGASIAYAGTGGPQVAGATDRAAMLSFHRVGSYAVNFGLDTDNQLKMGANAYTILHSGNYTSYVSPPTAANVQAALVGMTPSGVGSLSLVYVGGVQVPGYTVAAPIPAAVYTGTVAGLTPYPLPGTWKLLSYSRDIALAVRIA